MVKCVESSSVTGDQLFYIVGLIVTGSILFIWLILVFSTREISFHFHNRRFTINRLSFILRNKLSNFVLFKLSLEM